MQYGYKIREKRIQRRRELKDLNFFQKIKKRREENGVQKGNLSLKNFLVFFLVLFIFLSYVFNLFLVQDNIHSVFTLIFTDSFILALFILVILFFVLWPISSIFITLILRFSDIIYKKGMKNIFYIIFIYFTFVLFIKIFIFNLQVINLDESWEWGLSYGLPIILFLGKFGVKKGLNSSFHSTEKVREDK